MNKLEIDFSELKYNLYQLLNVSQDADESKIKKSFIKIIKSFHPDKNSELEEDIYYHIVIANQILLNKNNREKYNNYLNEIISDHFEIKNSFSKIKNNLNIQNETKSKELFKNKLEELNKKHGYKEINESVIDKFHKVKDTRNNITINKEDIKNEKEFNDKFINNKINGKLKDQIIEYKDNTDLITFDTESYTKINDLDKLYIEDSIQNSKYSSLDRAFILQPIIEYNSLSIENKIKEYEDFTNIYKNMNFNNFIKQNQ